MEGCETGFVLVAGFGGVFWSIAGGADLEFAGGAGEDAAVLFAVVRLHGLFGFVAAVHADVALVQHDLHGVAEMVS